MTKPTGWQNALIRNAQGLPPIWMVETGNSEFDKLLRQEKVNLKDAHRNQVVREWILKNFRRRYIPLAVLEACGIRPEEVA